MSDTPAYDLICEIPAKDLTDDAAYPLKAGGDWRLDNGEQPTPSFETSLMLRRDRGRGPAWRAELADVTITDRRVLFSVLRLKRSDGSLSLGAAGSGHLRYDWVSRLIFAKGGLFRLAAARLEFLWPDGTTGELSVEASRRSKRAQALVEAVALYRNAPSPSLDGTPIELAGAVPFGERR